MRCKYILARKVEKKIAAIRRKEREKAYQKALFAPGSNVELSFEASDAFTFKIGMYAGERRYRGHWKPSKHFLGPDKVPAFDGVKDKDGEEVQCAQAIDSLPSVKYWIRNVARHPQSFWLPTSTDRFYPDFVALLNDGRLLVVEYKGAHSGWSRYPGKANHRTAVGSQEATANALSSHEKEVNEKNMHARSSSSKRSGISPTAPARYNPGDFQSGPFKKVQRVKQTPLIERQAFSVGPEAAPAKTCEGFRT